MEKNQALYNQMKIEVMYNPNLVFWPLQMILVELCLPWRRRIELKDALVEILKSEECEQAAADRVWKALGEYSQNISNKLVDRSQLVWSQIESSIAGRTILDFGCGDGRVSELAHTGGFDVQAYDIADYRSVSYRHIPFTKQWSRVRGEVDTALAVTVFHHCEDPEREIARLRKVAKRVVVIESIIDEAMPWVCQAFVDWLYNRGMHPGAAIPVPGQFKTVQEWKRVFDRHGFKVVHEQDLGIDLPIVPEHHYLFILE